MRLAHVILLIPLLSICSTISGQPITYRHYQNIITDTTYTNVCIVTKEYNGKKTFRNINSRKGKLKEIKCYTENKLVFKAHFLAKNYYSYKYEYDYKGRLTVENKYFNNNLLYKVTYAYKDNQLTKTTYADKYSIQTFNFKYDQNSRIASEEHYVSSFLYSKRLTTYIDDSLSLRCFVMSLDTNSNFKRIDTLSYILIDKVKKITYEKFHGEYSTITSIDSIGRIQSVMSLLADEPNEENVISRYCYIKDAKGQPLILEHINLCNGKFKTRITMEVSKKRLLKYL